MKNSMPRTKTGLIRAIRKMRYGRKLRGPSQHELFGKTLGKTFGKLLGKPMGEFVPYNAELDRVQRLTMSKGYDKPRKIKTVIGDQKDFVPHSTSWTHAYRAALARAQAAGDQAATFPDSTNSNAFQTNIYKQMTRAGFTPRPILGSGRKRKRAATKKSVKKSTKKSSKKRSKK